MYVVHHDAKNVILLKVIKPELLVETSRRTVVAVYGQNHRYALIHLHLPVSRVARNRPEQRPADSQTSSGRVNQHVGHVDVRRGHRDGRGRTTRAGGIAPPRDQGRSPTQLGAHRPDHAALPLQRRVPPAPGGGRDEVDLRLVVEGRAPACEASAVVEPVRQRVDRIVFAGGDAPPRTPSRRCVLVGGRARSLEHQHVERPPPGRHLLDHPGM
mmetsp:Transcript_30059/g.71538  ORF Transcript_30059/g.71538 Transcript_30059/m.71538 type:complete len:213 (+) Transcript_30059:224-862(+)